MRFIESRNLWRDLKSSLRKSSVARNASCNISSLRVSRIPVKIRRRATVKSRRFLLADEKRVHATAISIPLTMPAKKMRAIGIHVSIAELSTRASKDYPASAAGTLNPVRHDRDRSTGPARIRARVSPNPNSMHRGRLPVRHRTRQKPDPLRRRLDRPPIPPTSSERRPLSRQSMSCRRRG